MLDKHVCICICGLGSNINLVLFLIRFIWFLPNDSNVIKTLHFGKPHVTYKVKYTVVLLTIQSLEPRACPSLATGPIQCVICSIFTLVLGNKSPIYQQKCQHIFCLAEFQ